MTRGRRATLGSMTTASRNSATTLTEAGSLALVCIDQISTQCGEHPCANERIQILAPRPLGQGPHGSANRAAYLRGYRAMLGRLSAAMWCLSFLLMTAAPLHALAKDERPVPPLPIDAKQATARDHARAPSEMADTAARHSARCQSSGAALGSQACKECRALLESKMSIGTDVPPDHAYTSGSRN
jgi:hypothetical protein